MSIAPAKDTVYIDAEDEITTIIDKVRASNTNVVALVLPKRASTLQSVVNLKLLKRTAANAKKNIVLITSEANLLPLAGMVGLHVAKTLQSKPAVPPVPKRSDNAITVEGGDSKGSGTELDPHASVGQLAGQLATEETIDLDNETAEGATVAAKPLSKLNKKLKVPNFDRFRLLVFGGGALLLLIIVGSIFAFAILPKAKVTIKTDTTNVTTNLTLTAKTDAKAVNAEQLLIPATSKELKKTDSEKVPATGQRDEGTKATGTVTLALTDCSQPQVTVPADTKVSSSSLVFITQSSATLISTVKGGKCSNDTDASATVNVVAQNAGDKYNLSARAYTVTGFSNVSAAGSAMSGGTSKVVQIISQQDVDNAKQKVLDRVAAAANTELNGLFLADKSLPLTETFTAGGPTVVSTPNVNDPGSEVNVSVTVTFNELGVKQADLKQVVETDIKKHIDSTKQVIQDNGIAKAIIRITDKKSANEVKFTIQTLAVAGPQLDGDGIKKQIAGKKKGEAQSIIQARPGIKDVNITYSPFWVFSTPKSTKHITVIFDQSNATK